jgi:hypothetical protein
MLQAAKYRVEMIDPAFFAPGDSGMRGSQGTGNSAKEAISST